MQCLLYAFPVALANAWAARFVGHVLHVPEQLLYMHEAIDGIGSLPTPLLLGRAPNVMVGVAPGTKSLWGTHGVVGKYLAGEGVIVL